MFTKWPLASCHFAKVAPRQSKLSISALYSISGTAQVFFLYVRVEMGRSYFVKLHIEKTYGQAVQKVVQIDVVVMTF